MKKCYTCKRQLALSEFHRNKYNKDGLGGHCKKCNIERVKAWQIKNKEKVLVYNRNRKRHLHGLSLDKYNDLLNKYGGKCHNCRNREASCIDHDHQCCPGVYSCGICVRGMLCHQCNTAIGLLGDSPDLAEKTARYLRAPLS